MTRAQAAEHLDADTVAAYEEGLLDARRRTRVAQHLSTCERCQAVSVGLTELQQTLRGTPADDLPADVAARLDTAMRQAAAQREHPEAGDPVAGIPSWRRYVPPITAAAAAAVLVGVVLVTPQSRTADSASEGGNTLAQRDAAGGSGGSGSLRSGHPLPRLSSASFRHDVSRLVSTALVTAPQSDRSHPGARSEAFESSACQPRPPGRSWKVLVDGRPAVLVIRPAARGPRRVAIAYTCGASADGIAAQARLPRR